MYTVYKHTCPNGKVYIGITQQNIELRWRNSGQGYIGQRFYRAILKYGWDNIKHEILFTDLTKEEACQKEIELIIEYRSNNPKYGYNGSLGGEGFLGVEPWNKGGHIYEETKEKLRRANYGKKASEETRKKMSEKLRGNQNAKGNKLSEETKRKMSDAQRGEKNSFYGKHHSDETRQKLKDAWKRRKEHARKIS